MTISNNSPSAGFISWIDLHIQYAGQTYTIVNGSTDKVYAWWTPSYPNNLVVSDTFPTLTANDCLVFLNKAGIAVVVPGSTITDGDLIVPGTILAAALAANAVTADKIAAGSVTAGAIAAGSITADAIAANAIGADKIAAGAVIADKILAGAITVEKIATGAITTNKILANAVTADKVNIADLFAAAATINALKAATVGSLEAGSIITINSSGVGIEGGTFAVNVEGTNGDMSLDEGGLSVNLVNSPSVVPKYLGASVLYVNKAATDAQVAGGNYFRSLGQALNSVTGKYIPNSVTITLTADTYSDGELFVRGIFGGGKLRIDGNGSVLNGVSIQFVSCAVLVEFVELTLYQMSANKHGVVFDSCASAYVADCMFVALATATSSYGAIVAQNGTPMYVTACQFYGLWRSIIVRSSASAASYNNKGDARLFVMAGTMIAEGTQPCDVATFGYMRGAGGVLTQSGTVTVDQGTATPPEPETSTATFAATTTRTAYGSSVWPSTWKTITNEFWQGFTSTQGYQVGMMWFSGIGAVAGKTILSARLEFKRVSGIGPGDDVKVVAYYGSLANSAGSGSPTSRVSMGTIGNIANGETIEVSIPTAAVSYLAASPTGRCIAFNPSDSSVLSGKSYSTNYAKFYGVGSSYVPELVVTYEP